MLLDCRMQKMTPALLSAKSPCSYALQAVDVQQDQLESVAAAMDAALCQLILLRPKIPTLLATAWSFETLLREHMLKDSSRWFSCRTHSALTSAAVSGGFHS